MVYSSEELFERKGLGGSSHGSTITEAPDGTLYAVWYSGSKEKAKDIKIYMSKKAPNESWATPWLIEKEGITSKNPFITGDEDPDELAELENEETSEGNPVIFCDQTNGRLFLMWVTMRGAGDRSGWSACIVKFKHSDDNGKNWTKPRVIRDMIGWMTRNKPIWLSNGDLLWPIMAEFTSAQSMFYRISRKELDKGAEECVIQEPDAFITGDVLQPSIVENEKGKLFCVMRTTEKTLNCPHLIATSRSDDFGHSWSVIAPTKERIPNPESGVDMVKLENGHIVMVCNPLPSGRQRLSAFLSEDSGISFPISRDFEPENGVIGDGEYSYPAVIQTKDGVIHCTYTNLRQNIKHVAFDENWIKTGK